ncbi:Uncharacterised protein [Mycobacteroides abscessus subsp. abscessus]|nr:Uncharacterised protein [Mycobacteroides abscessus subsp. abscessus]
MPVCPAAPITRIDSAASCNGDGEISGSGSTPSAICPYKAVNVR